jgi:hypothetical protein
MQNLSTRPFVPVLAALLWATACGGGDKGDAMARDSALSRDLNMAQPNASAPQLSDTSAAAATSAPAASGAAAARAPRNAAPAMANTASPKPAAAPAPAKAIAAGTRFVLAAGSTVCTNTHKVGDTFTATVFEPVTSGAVTVSQGTAVTLELTRLERKTGVNNEVAMDVAAKSILISGKRYAIDGSVTPDITKVRAESKSADVQKVAAGAAIGAAAGALLGKNTKSAVIGAAAGTAAGVGVAAAASNYDGCINENSKLVLVTGSAVTLQ